MENPGIYYFNQVIKANTVMRGQTDTICFLNNQGDGHTTREVKPDPNQEASDKPTFVDLLTLF